MITEERPSLEDVNAMLIQRNEDLESEKAALLEENDALAADNIEIRRQLVMMRGA